MLHRDKQPWGGSPYLIASFIRPAEGLPKRQNARTARIGCGLPD
jgi:hypothetical protein